MQAAIEESMARHQSGFDELLKAEATGQFVVVAETIAFCPSTDAVIGTDYRILKKFNNQDLAIKFLADYIKNLYEDEALDPDLLVYVFPRIDAPVLNQTDDVELSKWAKDVPF